MAVNPLNLMASLRPWRTAGVSHLLVEADLSCPAADRPLLPLTHPAPTDDTHCLQAEDLSGDAQRDRTPASGMPRETSSTLIADTTTPFARTTAPASTPASTPASALADRPAAASPGVVRTAPAASTGPASTTDPACWPAPWRQLIKKTRPAPLLWTYEELATDLLAPDAASTARSGVLRGLISELSLPRGSSTFWPLSVSAALLSGSPDSQGGLSPHGVPHASAHGTADCPAAPSSGTSRHDSACGNIAQAETSDPAAPFHCSVYFLAGLALLAPKIIVLFGAIGHPDSAVVPPYTQQITGGRVFVYLPPLADLQGAAQRRSGAFLRSVLSQFPLFPNGQEGSL